MYDITRLCLEKQTKFKHLMYVHSKLVECTFGETTLNCRKFSGITLNCHVLASGFTKFKLSRDFQRTEHLLRTTEDFELLKV